MKPPAVKSKLTLRTRPAVLWRVAVLALMTSLVLSMVLRVLQGDALRPPPPWLVPSFAIAMVAIQYLLFPARADDRGLRCFDGWGMLRLVPWHEMADVELRRWVGMLFAPALCITDTKGRRRWLPRETQNLAALHRLLQAQVPPGHPLLKALNTPLHAL